ncbi:unnamed protein product [Acanthoscelides obtectus]|uniref:39S ribosomal protein S30, mitochondrial n=1 Tax=Acanthoscelides obtectus TaxID=200917 RepID=A0A9P0PQU0_ACAOB|nr:unnamed protein product [Acanthoscelides obtectus]CAK1676989.1 28S ribosomal protein S30, mitochondrial [Acanthoscelides obtectus]
MSLTRFNKVCRRLNGARYFAIAVHNPEQDEYTSKPHYPPIEDLSFREKLKRKKAKLHDEIRNVKTVEEKQIKLNMRRYYGFKCYMVNEGYCPYNNLPLAQHITRTHLKAEKKLPQLYDNIDVSSLATQLKNDVEEIILIETEGYRKKIKDKILGIEDGEDFTSALTKSINRMIMSNLAKQYPHILDTQFDFEPRIESTWYAGGMNPPDNIKRYREGRDWTKEYKDDPTDRLMAFIGLPILTLRSQLPLPTVAADSDVDGINMELPEWQYDPRVVGTKTEQNRRIVNVPGYFPGDTHRFSQLSYHKRHHARNTFGEVIDEECSLSRQAIVTSFGWLQAQANMLGFNSFNDITYPMITQTVITDGKNWSFFVYQMNTILFHTHFAKENPKRNICWGTDEMKLYEGVSGGKVLGFNEEVLKTLLKFYVNEPRERLGVNLTPFLSNEEKVAADYTDDDKSNWLEREYKFLTSNRPRYQLPYEIYAWEKIYKIDHQSRFMDKRLRPFELFQNPYDRRLDDRLPEYIPRKLRPDVKRWVGRYKKEYFP